MSDRHVLIVDSDAQMRMHLRAFLEREGFRVTEACSARLAQKLIAHSPPFDLMTLEPSLEDGSGLELARQVRATSDMAIIMISSKDDVIDRIVGLEVGADDYITKPFHEREVLARVRCVLRRATVRSAQISTFPRQARTREPQDPRDVASTRYHMDGLTVIPDQFELLDRSGRRSEMTSGDFKLLGIFLERPKRVLSRDQLMDLIGGIEWHPLDRTVDNQVARLRKRIERDPASPTLIKTVRGVGYMLACEVDVTKAVAAAQSA